MGKIGRTTRASGEQKVEARIEMSTPRAQAMDDGDSVKDGNDQVESSGLGEQTMEGRIEMSTPRAQAMDDGDSVKDCNDQVESSTRSGNSAYFKPNFINRMHEVLELSATTQSYVGMVI